MRVAVRPGCSIVVGREQLDSRGCCVSMRAESASTALIGEVSMTCVAVSLDDDVAAWCKCKGWSSVYGRGGGGSVVPPRETTVRGAVEGLLGRSEKGKRMV